jgi:hypothetical protein
MMNDISKEILKRFSESWDKTEQFYDYLLQENDFEFIRPIKLLINKLRKDEGDKFFRLGTSMHTLIFSRSVDHGLRLDQKYISIEALEKDRFEIMFKDAEKIYRQYRVENLADIQVTKLLKTLKSVIVD